MWFCRRCFVCLRLCLWLEAKSWLNNFSFGFAARNNINENRKTSKRKTHFEKIFLDALQMCVFAFFILSLFIGINTRRINAQLNYIFKFSLDDFQLDECVSCHAVRVWAKNKLDAVGMKWSYNLYYSQFWMEKHWTVYRRTHLLLRSILNCKTNQIYVQFEPDQDREMHFASTQPQSSERS